MLNVTPVDTALPPVERNSPGPVPVPAAATPAFLAGGGEMGERMRRKDWGKNVLGPPEQWPQSLKTAVRIMLTSRQAIWIGWGPELIYLYNDAYRAIVGGKHPQALGQPTRRVWGEIWDVIAPMLSTAMTGDEGTYVESQLLIMERHGYREETYYTFSYSPIPNDDGSAGGIICANTDDTQQVLGERQLGLLRDLAAQTAEARTWQEACAGGRSALASNARDLPFALIYLSQPGSAGLALVETCGIAPTHPAATHAWPLEQALRSREIVVVENLDELFDGQLPTGAWEEPPRRAALVPLADSGHTGRSGVLVVGLNPFRLFDAKYRNFLNLAGGQIAAGIARAQAYEDERRRAESLAELDRAKTEFFSNVSHEFRTPLTLMLGPVEDLLASGSAALEPAAREQLQTVHRNSLRLLKLVNTMLDFSRIEAGRVTASFAAVDLAAYTAELASVFRATIERAGVRFIVDCPPLAAPVYVDQGMWEKIVLNLLSNAFKFTLAGEIEVRLDTEGDQAQLIVRDTGVGIPSGELARVFERFHRVKESRGRTHEGTGIGLALVQELVRLHGGTIRVESVIDQGSSFIVTLPLVRPESAPASRVDAAGRPASRPGVAAFAHEALRWVQGGETGREQWERTARTRPPASRRAGGEALDRVLLADDNADMRDYVGRLLAERFEVTAVSDGQAALESIRAHPPALVLSDVMMPRLDGFGLLQALRADPALNRIPIILLSARAGEEARVEGVGAGADDYLVKPFSARELLARVEAHVKMARFRRESEAALRESEARFRAIVETTPECVKLVTLDGTVLQMNSAGLAMIGAGTADEVIGQSVYDVIGAEHRDKFRQFNERVCAGERGMLEFDIVGLRGERRHVETHAAPLHLTDGSVVQLAVTRDVSARRQVEDELRAGDERVRQANAELAKRVLELQEAGAEIRRSRRAALNLMQDAVHVRDQVEQLNAELHLKIAEREEAHRRVRQRTAQFETLLNQAPLGVYVVDADFQIRDVNPTARVVFGDIPDLIGADFRQVIHQLWHPDFAEEIIGRFRHTMRTGEPYSSPERIEPRLDRAATEFYEWRLDRIPLPDGRFGVVCYFRDISAQVQARLVISDSEERYRSIVSVITDVPWITNAAGEFAALQPAWQAYTGQTWEEQRGFGWAQAIHPDDRDQMLAEWARERRDPKRFESAGRFWHAGSRTWRHFVVKAAPLFNSDGSVREWVGSCTDNENQIQAEQQIKIARDDALAANRAKDEFLATLSHELRTPLNPVLLIASECASDLKLSEEVRTHFRMIADNVSLQARLIDDLLDLSRIIRGKLNLEFRPLDLHALVRDAATTIAEDIAEKRLVLGFELGATTPAISGDPVRLRQIFWNVLKNAAKFTPNGGRITVSSSDRGKGEIELRFRDSGIGMRSDELARVFDPFVQGRHADEENRTAYGGLGLGLAISRMLLEGHGGNVVAESAGPGQGTTIVVWLPRAPVATAGEVPPKSDPSSNGRHSSETRALPAQRILLVEDHGPTRNAVTALLRLRGHEVVVAESMHAALRTEGKFDVLISDLGLPDGDGCMTMAGLRRRQPDLVGIAISGYGMDADLERSRAAGFGEHLTKPVSIDAIERALHRLVENAAT